MSEKTEMNWEDYENITRYIYESLGTQYGIKVVGHGNKFKVKGKSTLKHQIDVLTEQTLGGKRILTAIECKYWKKKVNKEVVMKLSKVMQDADIAKGIIVCKTGFTRDTLIYAESEGINLVELKEIGDDDADFGRNVELATIDVHLNVIRARPNITSVDFGTRTLHFDPSIGNVYCLQLQDAAGNHVPLKSYLFEFGKQLLDRGEELKNITADFKLGRSLFINVDDVLIAVDKFSVTGFLTVDDLSTTKYLTLQDQVWMIMNELFDKRKVALSKSGLIWNIAENK